MVAESSVFVLVGDEHRMLLHVPVTPAHGSIESMGNQALVLLMNHQEHRNYFPATQSILPLIKHVLSC